MNPGVGAIAAIVGVVVFASLFVTTPIGDFTSAIQKMPFDRNYENYSQNTNISTNQTFLCFDSDGEDYYTYGNVTLRHYSGKFITYYDECSDWNTVMEQLCKAGQRSYKYYDCPVGCEGGRCEEMNCTDSDGGIEYYQEGHVEYMGETYPDVCDTSTDILTEYYCDSGAESVEFSCPHGCCSSGGVCKLQTCEDSDATEEYPNGKNYYQFGETIETWECYYELGGAGGQTPAEDRCIDEYTLREYYCENDDRVYEDYDCSQEGKICVDGECVINYSCTDTDGGRNYYEKGTVCDYYGCLNDSCINSQNLHEMYCNETGFMNGTVFNCSQVGMACYNGACVNESFFSSVCMDSDAGDNIWMKGTLEYIIFNSTGNYTYYYDDFCYDSDLLLENYCLDRNRSFKRYNCSDYDAYCEGGRCKINASERYYTCFDSDGGIEPYIPGFVNISYYRLNGSLLWSTIYYDYCSDIETLREYYCENPNSSSAGEIDYYCLFGCENNNPYNNGSCRNVTNPNCNDTDMTEEYPNGRNPFEKGTATDDYGSYTDYCTNPSNGDNLMEYYCYLDELTFEPIDCYNDYGMICENGSCVNATIENETECNDTDGGYNIYEKGTATGYWHHEWGEYTDYCEGQILNEFYCVNLSGGRYVVYILPTTCPYACYDGTCINGSRISLNGVGDEETIDFSGIIYTFKLIGWNTNENGIYLTVNDKTPSTTPWIEGNTYVLLNTTNHKVYVNDITVYTINGTEKDVNSTLTVFEVETMDQPQPAPPQNIFDAIISFFVNLFGG